MQAPVWVLGPAEGGRGAPVSSAVHRGTFRFSFGCLGWCAVPAPGQVGRSRDTWSRQEDPIRFRILIDIQNLSYMADRSRSRLLKGSGGRLCAAGNSSPEPTTNPLRKIPSRLSASTQHHPCRGNRPLAGWRSQWITRHDTAAGAGNFPPRHSRALHRWRGAQPQRHRPGDSDHGHRPQGAAHRSQAPGSARSVPQDAPSRGAVRCLGSVRAGKPASEVCASYSVRPAAWYRSPGKYRRR